MCVCVCVICVCSGHFECDAVMKLKFTPQTCDIDYCLNTI